MLPHNGFGMEKRGRHRRHLGDDEGDENRPDRYTTLSEECVCHEVVHVVVAVGHYAVLFCAVQQ